MRHRAPCTRSSAHRALLPGIGSINDVKVTGRGAARFFSIAGPTIRLVFNHPEFAGGGVGWRISELVAAEAAADQFADCGGP